MSNLRANRELSLPVQFAALSLLWTVWGSILAYVVLRGWQLHQVGRSYKDPFAILLILLVAMPLTLALAGLDFQRRLGPASRLAGVRRVLFRVVQSMTVTGVLVALLGAVCTLLAMGPVRE
jgi:hypothetical protein